MKTIKITFVGLILSIFPLAAMAPQSRNRGFGQQQNVGYVGWSIDVSQKKQQPSELERIWENLARKYERAGVFDQGLAAEFNQLRGKGLQFDHHTTATPTDTYLQQQLGITDAEWQAFMPY